MTDATVVCPRCEAVISSLDDHDRDCPFRFDPGPFPVAGQPSDLRVEDYHCLFCGEPHGGDPLVTDCCSDGCRAGWYELVDGCDPPGEPGETPSLEQPW